MDMSMGPPYKPKFKEAKRIILENDKEIAELKSRIIVLNEEKNTDATSHTQALEGKAEEITSLEQKIARLEEEKSTLEESLKTTKEDLRSKELNKFAGEFRKEEVRYEREQRSWFSNSVRAGAIVLVIAILTAFDIFDSNGTGIFPEIEIIFLNALTLTVFLYSLKQHSHLADLREDYANRKALAQSYQYMVEGDDPALLEIKNEFFKEAMSVFTKRPKGRGSDVTWQESIFARFLGPKS